MTLWFNRLTISFHHHDYRRYWTGSIITIMAFRMHNVVLGWQMLEATDSALWVGLVPFTYGLPLLIWSPFSGVLADRMKRQSIMALALTQASVCTAGLALLTAMGKVSPWHILITSFMVGSAFPLYAPARSALLPNLVPAKAFLNASTIDYSSTRLMGFFGPVMAGALIDAMGVWRTLTVQVMLFLLAGLVFSRTGLRIGRPLLSADQNRNVLSGVREAVAYVRGDQPLMALALLSLIMVPIGMSSQGLMPVFVRDVLGGGASILGLTVGVWYLGLGLAGLGLAAIGDTFRKGRVVLLSSGLLSAGLVIFAFAQQVSLALMLLFVLGLVAGVYLTLTNVLFQVRPPDALRGRVVGAWGMVWGLVPFTSLAAGAVAEGWGVSAAIAASGAVSVVFCIGMSLVGSHLGEL